MIDKLFFPQEAQVKLFKLMRDLICKEFDLFFKLICINGGSALLDFGFIQF